jgi:hypothetical protein
MRIITDKNYRYTPWSPNRRREAMKRALHRAWGPGFREPLIKWLRSKEAAAEKRVKELQSKQTSAENFTALLKAQGRHEAFAEALATAAMLEEPEKK